MAVLRLNEVSLWGMNGFTSATVHFYFKGDPVGAPIYVPADRTFVPFPPNTDSADFTAGDKLHAHINGNLVGKGGKIITSMPDPGDDLTVNTGVGQFRVKYQVLVDNHSSYPLDNYTHAIHLNPNNIIAYYNRGNALYHLGDYQSAIADYTQALTLNPNYSDIYNNRGLTRLQVGDIQGAIADYTQAITLNPNDAKIYSNRGSARNKLGDIQGSLEDYTQAIRLNPDYAPAYYNRGVLRSQSGKRRAGMKDFREADALAQKQRDLALHQQVKAAMKRR